MSYTIEYHSMIYKFPKELENSSEDSYLMVVDQGDNNVYEHQGKRAHEPYILCYGWKYNIIAKVCTRAGSCEGGSLQPNGKYMTPENYLKKYRELIKNAPTCEVFFRQAKKARFELKEDLSGDYEQGLLTEYKEFIHEEIGYYSKKPEQWAEIIIDGYESFNKFTKLWSIARFHDVYIN